MKTKLALVLTAAILTVTLLVASQAAPTSAGANSAPTPTGHAGHHEDSSPNSPSASPTGIDVTPSPGGSMMDMTGMGMMDHMTETPMMPMDGMAMMGDGDTGRDPRWNPSVRMVSPLRPKIEGGSRWNFGSRTT